jgi:dTMP kinase
MQFVPSPAEELDPREAITMAKGKFIVLDGTDGSGKTTQFKLLVEALKNLGYQVEHADFPQYGKKSAGPVEEYLNGRYGQINPHAGSILYAVDRFDASFQIRQWLDEGKIVISNRYVTANAGHQGGKIDTDDERAIFFGWLKELEYNIFKIPQPDLNIILHVPAHIAQELVDKKPDEMRIYAEGKKRDIHEADLDHLKKAEKVFLQVHEHFPNTELVACFEDGKLMSIEEIHKIVLDKVRKVI